MDPKFIEKAKADLGEDELKKSQALMQFREYISKHPYFSEAEFDDIFLLQHLRNRKYRMNEVFQSFEKFLLARKKFPQFCVFDSVSFNKFLSLSTTSSYVTMKHRDSEGRRVILTRTVKRRPEETSENDEIKSQYFASLLAVREEETQIAGIVLIVDLADVTLKHSFSPATIVEVFKFLNYCLSFRLSAIYFVNIKPLLGFVLDSGFAFVSEKMKKRFHVLQNLDDLKNFIDPNILPKEYGGNCDFNDAVEDFGALYEKHKEALEKFVNLKIDWSKVPEKAFINEGDGENIGSFRKLEVD